MSRSRPSGHLANSGSDAPVDSLIQSLKNTDWYVRWGAVEALGNIGDNRALDSIRNLLDDKDEYVRRAAEEAIRKIKKKNE